MEATSRPQASRHSRLGEMGLHLGGFEVAPATAAPNRDIVAVKVGHQGKGYGRQLKQAVLPATREAGALALVSLVDRRNTQMIGLNLKLGGVVERLDDDDENPAQPLR